MAYPTTAFGVTKEKDPIGAMELIRRELTPLDVLVKILYCGICHSDKHHLDNDWDDSKYPMVPGHEIIGRVLAIGSDVTTLVIGDEVAIGNLTDSCKYCLRCDQGEEQYCLNDGPTWVYNGRERLAPNGGRFVKPEGDRTFGGYSGKIVAQEKFVLKLPAGLDLAASAPLLCAGITVLYPLKRWQIGKGHKVGIAGIGGLGHLAVKFAKVFGAEVVALTTSQWKLGDAARLGADAAVLIDQEFKDGLNALDKLKDEKPLTTAEQQALVGRRAELKYAGYFDFILCTIPVAHDPTPYLQMLSSGQSLLHVVGNMNEFPGLKGMKFVFGGKNITSSNVGGIRDTKEMLGLCALHGIQADISLVRPEEIDAAMVKVVDKEARYRYVIDLTNVE